MKYVLCNIMCAVFVGSNPIKYYIVCKWVLN